ncbi:MAG: hypothetical protein AAGI92_06155 [Pseudomonadota bacterium]
MGADREGEVGSNVSVLKTALRDIKIAAADRNDVVVEMRDADRARLEILGNELSDVIADVPTQDDRFDFAISSGLQPRFWIDATAHVMMGRDRRTYRFVRDTRLGRIVLAEAIEIEPIKEAVVRYIAGRLHEREQVLAGDVLSLREQHAASTVSEADTERSDAQNLQDDAKVDERQRKAQPQVPASTLKNQAEPSTARAFASLFVILAFIGVVFAVLLWSTGRLG